MGVARGERGSGFVGAMRRGVEVCMCKGGVSQLLTVEARLPPGPADDRGGSGRCHEGLLDEADLGPLAGWARCQPRARAEHLP